MTLAGLPPLRDVVARHGLSASKALGQNFLFDEQMLDRIASIPGDISGEQLFEVGPGPGGLTRALLRAGAHVTAIERDARCLPALAELAEASGGRLRVIAGDAMQHEADTLMPPGHYHIVANLPYNVGTALLLRWLESAVWPPRWRSLTLMFQNEVAQRIIAQPGTPAYGRLAIAAQWRSRARIAMRVHRSAFTPPPKVQSAIVHIVPTDQPVGTDATILARITAAAFGQRRKMLRQSLRPLPAALDALDTLGIDSQRRAETLCVADYVALARAVAPTLGIR